MKILIDDVIVGYLDETQKYCDYGTAVIDGDNIIDCTTTGMSYYNQFLKNNKIEEVNGTLLAGDIILMSPEEYYKECAKTCWDGFATVHVLKVQRQRDTKILENLKGIISIYKRKLCLPMIDYYEGRQQGLHRMYVIGELYGWDFKVPVLVIKKIN